MDQPRGFSRWQSIFRLSVCKTRGQVCNQICFTSPSKSRSCVVSALLSNRRLLDSFRISYQSQDTDWGWIRPIREHDLIPNESLVCRGLLFLFLIVANKALLSCSFWYLCFCWICDVSVQAFDSKLTLCLLWFFWDSRKFWWDLFWLHYFCRKRKVWRAKSFEQHAHKLISGTRFGRN